MGRQSFSAVIIPPDLSPPDGISDSETSIPVKPVDPCFFCLARRRIRRKLPTIKQTKATS